MSQSPSTCLTRDSCHPTMATGPWKTLPTAASTWYLQIQPQTEACSAVKDPGKALCSISQTQCQHNGQNTATKGGQSDAQHLLCGYQSSPQGPATYSSIPAHLLWMLQVPRPPHKNFSKVMDKYKVVLRFACRHVMDPRLGATTGWVPCCALATQNVLGRPLAPAMVELLQCIAGHMREY